MDRPDKRIRKIKVTEEGYGILRESPEKNYHIPENQPFYYGPDFPNRVKTIKKITIRNSKNMIVEIITLGARIITIQVPNKYYIFENIVLDFDKVSDYFKENRDFFNCLVGRVGGPGAQQVQNAQNKNAEGPHRSKSSSILKNPCPSEFTINEDIFGFDKVLWESRIIPDGVILSYHSKDGQMGFVGDVIVNVRYRINHENKLFIDISAISDEPTPINITQLINMNLGGYHSGVNGIKKHIFTMNTDRIIETTPELEPTGTMTYLKNTPFDLRMPRQLEGIIYDIPGGGFDHFFRTNGTRTDGVRLVGRIVHPYSGRTLEIFSNQPCFSLYTGGRLPVPFFKHVQEPYPSEYDNFFKYECSNDREKCAASMLEDLMPLLPNDGNYYDPKYQIADDELLKHGHFRGKNGCRYNHLGSFSVVPSWFPNGIKEINFPQRTLKPFQVYKNKIEYHFGITRREQFGHIYGEDVVSLPSEDEGEIIPLPEPE